jgi:hypothetical protein
MEKRIKNSFDKLIQLYDKQDEEQTIPEYFCDKECYEKFLITLQKIKQNDIDMNNFNFREDNFISNLMTQFYNKGYNDGYYSFLHK